MHTGGVISKQYLEVCRKYKVTLTEENDQVGNVLVVTPEYFKQACECFYEIGVKLGQVIWRKVIGDKKADKERFAEADENLIDVVFNLLTNERYDLTKCMCEFALDKPMKHASQRDELIFKVNQLIAYKFGGEAKKILQILQEMDWSAYSYEFQLARAVLSDNYQEAAKIMLKLGPKDEQKMAYKTWPLYKEFRQTPQFLEAYQAIFGESFVLEQLADVLQRLKEASIISDELAAEAIETLEKIDTESEA